jgi:hypothetical protein
VVKLAMIRTMLALVAGRRWPMRQLDVSNAFPHGHLNELVLYQQPIGFIDVTQPDAVCLLSKSLYGLRQAPRAWFMRIAGFLRAIGFVVTRSDTSLFVLHRGMDMAFLLLYVNDMVLSASTEALLQDIVHRLQSEFAMKDMGQSEFAVKDMGPLRYFLGIDVQRHDHGFFLSQAKYAKDLLDWAGMTNCKLTLMPIDTKAKLPATIGAAVHDPGEYRSIAAHCSTSPSLVQTSHTYVVQQACLHMHEPRECHLAVVKCILCYVHGTT